MELNLSRVKGVLTTISGKGDRRQSPDRQHGFWLTAVPVREMRSAGGRISEQIRAKPSCTLLPHTGSLPAKPDTACHFRSGRAESHVCIFLATDKTPLQLYCTFTRKYLLRAPLGFRIAPPVSNRRLYRRVPKVKCRA